MNRVVVGLEMLLLCFFISISARANDESDQKYLDGMYSGRASFLLNHCRKSHPISSFIDYSPTYDEGTVLEKPMLFYCYGLIVRGTRQVLPSGQNAWDPYPENRTQDTSFSYINPYIKMKRLAWGYSNGFIIDPPLSLRVNCFYPLDAESDKRVDNGCGVFYGDWSANPECPASENVAADLPAQQRCRFDLRGSDAVDKFRLGINAAARLSRLSELPNDLKIQTWKKGCDARLKIRAFFYVSEEGRAFAERDRNQYQQVCGKHVALVYIKLPSEEKDNTTFEVVHDKF